MQTWGQCFISWGLKLVGLQGWCKRQSSGLGTLGALAGTGAWVGPSLGPQTSQLREACTGLKAGET